MFFRYEILSNGNAYISSNINDKYIYIYKFIYPHNPTFFIIKEISRICKGPNKNQTKSPPIPHPGPYILLFSDNLPANGINNLKSVPNTHINLNIYPISCKICE